MPFLLIRTNTLQLDQIHFISQTAKQQWFRTKVKLKNIRMEVLLGDVVNLLLQLYNCTAFTAQVRKAIVCSAMHQSGAISRCTGQLCQALEATCGAYSQPLALLGRYANKFNSLQNSCYCSNQERCKINQRLLGLR